MWFWRRRRRLPPPVLLPSLDRLAELVERVVALLDDLSLAPDPARAERAPLERELEPAPPPVEVGWVAFVHTPEGYRLLERDGAAPSRGAVVELEGEVFRVLRLGPSPLPGDRRRCALVEQERPVGERTFDG